MVNFLYKRYLCIYQVSNINLKLLKFCYYKFLYLKLMKMVARVFITTVFSRRILELEIKVLCSDMPQVQVQKFTRQYLLCTVLWGYVKYEIQVQVQNIARQLCTLYCVYSNR